MVRWKWRDKGTWDRTLPTRRITVGLAFYEFTHTESTGGRVALPGAGLCTTTFFGLRTGQCWSRWIGGAIAVLLTLAPVFGLFSTSEITFS